MARVSQFASADQILAAQLPWVEAFITEVLPVEQLGRFAPSATLVGSFDIGLCPRRAF